MKCRDCHPWKKLPFFFRVPSNLMPAANDMTLALGWNTESEKHAMGWRVYACHERERQVVVKKSRVGLGLRLGSNEQCGWWPSRCLLVAVGGGWWLVGGRR